MHSVRTNTGRPFGAILVALALLIALPAVAQASGTVAPPAASEDFVDYDSDGVEDVADNCHSQWNADQADADGDSIGDACDEQPPPDGDGDGAPDDVDNCPTFFNPEQTDVDGDGLGDSCDENPNGPPPGGGDSDGDGYVDVDDNCPAAPNVGQED